MKKVLLFLTLFILPLQADAYQDYIIFSDNPVSSAVIEDSNIAEVFPLQTIANKKETILLKAKKDGKTNIIITTSQGERRIGINVKSDKIIFNDLNGFNTEVCDIPPQNLKINGLDVLLPPTKAGEK